MYIIVTGSPSASFFNSSALVTSNFEKVISAPSPTSFIFGDSSGASTVSILRTPTNFHSAGRPSQVMDGSGHSRSRPYCYSLSTSFLVVNSFDQHNIFPDGIFILHPILKFNCHYYTCTIPRHGHSHSHTCAPRGSSIAPDWPVGRQPKSFCAFLSSESPRYPFVVSPLSTTPLRKRMDHSHYYHWNGPTVLRLDCIHSRYSAYHPSPFR